MNGTNREPVMGNMCQKYKYVQAEYHATYDVFIGGYF